MDFRDAWLSHNYTRRTLDIGSGGQIVQYRCSRCGRDFVDSPSGERYAVSVSAFGFRKLPVAITRRWLQELCPCELLPGDVELRNKVIEKGGVRVRN